MNNVIRSLLAAGVFCGVFIGGQAAATPIVVPNTQTSVEGNDANFGPFFDTSVRYQQVYSASQFPSGPLMISQIAFRPDGAVTDANFTLFFNSIHIELSTTSRTPGTLSTVFADNIGADNTTVFDSFVFIQPPITGPAGGPKDFVVAFNITPFIYDPSAGNLLLDVRAFESGGGISAQLDAQANNPFTAHVDASGISSTSGHVFATGLVTQFQVAAVTRVAEPSTLMLSAIALLVSMGALRRRSGRVTS